MGEVFITQTGTALLSQGPHCVPGTWRLNTPTAIADMDPRIYYARSREPARSYAGMRKCALENYDLVCWKKRGPIRRESEGRGAIRPRYFPETSPREPDMPQKSRIGTILA
jgi:hypothetical protein